MSKRRFARLSVATVLAAAVLVGCSDNPPPADDSTPTPSVTQVRDPRSSEAVSAAAEAAVERYYNVRNELRSDTESSLEQLDQVAASTELSAQQNLIQQERGKGVHQTGTTTIVAIESQAVDLDNSDPKSGKVPTVQLDVCYDVSGVDIVDSNGKSTISGDRSDTGWIRYTVANYDWENDPEHSWRVASSQDLEREPCDAA